MKKIFLIIILLTSINFAQSEEMLLLFDGAGYDAEAKAYFDAMTTPLSTAQKTKINSLVLSLKDSLGITSLATYFDVLYIHANETSESGLRNLVKRSFDVTDGNSTAFTQWVGFSGDNTADYLETQFTPSTAGGVFTQNSGSMGQYTNTVATIGNYDMGAIGANTFISAFGSRNSREDIVYLNAATNTTNNITTAAGMRIITRTNTTVSNYINKVGVDATQASGGLPNSEIFLLCTNSSGSPFAYSNAKISASFIGKGLTAVDVRKITNCIEVYMDAIGAGKIP